MSESTSARPPSLKAQLLDQYLARIGPKFQGRNPPIDVEAFRQRVEVMKATEMLYFLTLVEGLLG